MRTKLHGTRIARQLGHAAPFQIVSDGYPVPGERYNLLMTADNPGMWLFHCHIPTHVPNQGVEPGGMLTIVKVDE